MNVSDSFTLDGSSGRTEWSTLAGSLTGTNSATSANNAYSLPSNTSSSEMSGTSHAQINYVVEVDQYSASSLHGGSNFTQSSSGSYANGSYALDSWLYNANTSGTSHAQLTSTFVETLTASGSFANGSANTLTSQLVLGGGGYCYSLTTVTDASSQSYNAAFNGTIQVSDTMLSSQDGSFSETVYEAGSYAGGSFALSSMVYDLNSKSSSSNSSSDSRTTTDTVSANDYLAVSHAPAGLLGAYSGWNRGTATQNDSVTGTHSTTQDNVSTYSLHEGGSFSGGSWNLSSYNLYEESVTTNTSNDSTTTLCQETGTYAGKRYSDSLLVYDVTGTFTRSRNEPGGGQHSFVNHYLLRQQGTFAGGKFSLSCFAFGRDQSSDDSLSYSSTGTENFSGTNSADGTPTAYSGQQTTSSSGAEIGSSSGSLHEEGTYANGSFSLSLVSYSGSGSDSFTRAESSAASWSSGSSGGSSSSWSSSGYSGSASSSEAASGHSSWSNAASGSFSGGSFSLGSYVLQGAAAGSSSASAASAATLNGVASSYSRSQSGAQSDSLYQAGTQNSGGFSNSSYHYQDSDGQTLTNAASGPGYANSDTWVIDHSTELRASGTSSALSSASYSYANYGGSGNRANNNSVDPGNDQPGPVVQFASPDVNLVPEVGGDGSSSGRGRGGSGGSTAPVPASLSLQQVTSSGGWLSDTAQLAGHLVSPGSSTTQVNGGTLSQSAGGAIVIDGGVLGGPNPLGVYAGAAVGQAVAAYYWADRFMPAPSAPALGSYGGQVWNALRPLFQLLDPWVGVTASSMENSVQGLLDVHLPPSPSTTVSSGDPFVDWVDEVLYNNGQPLTAGSAPLYGTYWDGQGHSAGEALSMAAPFVEGGVAIVAGMWMVGPAGLAGLSGPAVGAFLDGATDVVVNASGGGTLGGAVAGFGGGFFSGAVFGSVMELVTGVIDLYSFKANAGSWDGALGRGLQKLEGLKAEGALTQVEGFGRSEVGIMEALDRCSPSGACFTGEMLLDVEGGKKRADMIVVGDRLWSRSESDPEGALTLKEVEEVFVRRGRVWNVQVDGHVLRTTGEHPFWVVNRGGWLAAWELAVGDKLQTRAGSLVTVEEVADSGEVTTVYNWRIEEYHTYFVGSELGGFSVWAHNACVYQAVDQGGAGTVRYVGIANQGLTRTLPARLTAAEARQPGLRASVIPGTIRFTEEEAAAVEQALIQHYGRQGIEPGGQLLNVYRGSNVNPANTALGHRVLWEIGYWDNPLFH